MESARLVEVAELGHLEPNRPLLVELDGEKILVIRFGREVVAVANRCPHLGGPLLGGTVRGPTIECPSHGWRFDLRTGRVARDWWTPPVSRATRGCLLRYRVVLDGSRVLLEIPARK